MGCYFPGWAVSIRDGVCVNGMGSYFQERCVSIWDGVLVNGNEC